MEAGSKSKLDLISALAFLQDKNPALLQEHPANMGQSPGRWQRWVPVPAHVLDGWLSGTVWGCAERASMSLGREDGFLGGSDVVACCVTSNM